MREIKFEFIYSNGLEYLTARASFDELCENNAPNDYMYEKASERYKDYDGIEDFILVAKRQSINILDLENNEIYVGDIVEDSVGRNFEIGYCFNSRNGSCRKYFCRYEMRCTKQSDNTSYAFTKIGQIVELIHWVHPTNELRVVGNIY
ncbi:MAG: hypothetical protein COB42_06810 [Sulfurimonas sp.]|nr:MAG: hypothetical protein COB42_06810 [Sulfurimonas sp.]